MVGWRRQGGGGGSIGGGIYNQGVLVADGDHIGNNQTGAGGEGGYGCQNVEHLAVRQVMVAVCIMRIMQS